MFRGGCFLLGQNLLLVATLHNIGEDEDRDHEVEGGLGHGHDGITCDVKVGEVSAFGEKHNADNEENEETENFIHAILLKEGCDSIRKPDHEDAADDDGDDHEFDSLVSSGLVFGQGHCRENGVEGEDHVHGDDEAHRLRDRGWLLVIMGEVVGAEHVENLFHGRVEDKGAAKENDDGVKVEGAINDVFNGGPCFFSLDAVMSCLGDNIASELEVKNGVLEFGDEGNHDEKENDAESDGEPDAQAAHEGLLFGSDSFGLERDVEKVVEAEDGLEQNQQEEGDDVFHGRDA